MGQRRVGTRAGTVRREPERRGGWARETSPSGDPANRKRVRLPLVHCHS